MNKLELKLLGRHEVCINSIHISLPSRKARALLFYLAVEPPHAHTRTRLAALLWPEDPPGKASHNLRQALSALRKALDNHGSADYFLEATRDSISLHTDSRVQIDIQAFMNCTLSSTGNTRSISRPDIRRLKKAAALYTGSFLEGFNLNDSDSFEEWAMLQRESLRRQAIQVFQTLIRYYRNRQDVARIMETGEKLFELAPWDEEVLRLLMSMYAHLGQKHTALSLYDAGVKYLQESLDLKPSAKTTELFDRLRRGELVDETPDRRNPFPSNLLPEPTPFVGRNRELDELSALISRPGVRLINLCGPGGIGKTRLALRAAAEQVGLFQDGVFFISLDAIQSADRVLPLIARLLDIQTTEEMTITDCLLAYLEEKNLLLIIDNFEHLHDAAPFLSQLLKRTWNLQMIVTSRQQLDIQQEWTYHLASMALPPHGAAPEELSAYESTSLFLNTARRMGLEHIEEANLGTIADICRLVEGFPLGIELAASTTRSHTLQEIKLQIHNNLGSLTASARDLPERHRSLRATFEHSWQLLDSTAKESLQRLSIFRGGFNPEIACSLTGSERETLDNLLASSLLARKDNRFIFHPLVQEFAREKLRHDPAEERDLLFKFAALYADILEKNSSGLLRPDLVQILQQLRPEENNISAAWEWMVSNGKEELINRAIHGLFRFYIRQSRFQEGYSAFSPPGKLPDSVSKETEGWLYMYRAVFASKLGETGKAATAYSSAEKCFQNVDAVTPHAACRTRQARAAIDRGQYEHAVELCEMALPVFQETDDHWWMAMNKFLAGDALYRSGKITLARSTLEESLSHARQSGDPGRISTSLNTLADVMCYQGEFRAAEEMFRECLDISRELQDHHSASVHLNNLGTIFHLQEELEEASFAYHESLNICRRLGDRYGEAIALSNLGEISLQEGDQSKSREYFQAGLEISLEINNTWSSLACLANLADISIQTDSPKEATAHLIRALNLAVDTHTSTMLPGLFLLAARIDLKTNHIQRASVLISHILHQDAVDELVRKQAAELANRENIDIRKKPTVTMIECARSLITSMENNSETS